MLNRLKMKEQYFFASNSSIPTCADELPETMLGSLLNIIKNYRNSAFNNIPRDEDGELQEDIIEYECSVINNLYALFFVNLWSFTEQFLTKNKRLFINLQHERNNEKTEEVSTIKYNDTFKNWFKQVSGTDINALSNEATANLVRLLCNHFKHDGSLQQIIPADLDPNATEKYINKGVKELDKAGVNLLKKFFTVSNNPAYSDLDIEKMMYEVGEFCKDFHTKVIEKYKNQNGLS